MPDGDQLESISWGVERHKIDYTRGLMFFIVEWHKGMMSEPATSIGANLQGIPSVIRSVELNLKVC